MRLLRRAMRVVVPATVATALVAAFGGGTAAAADEFGPGFVARSQMTLYTVPDGIKFCVHGELAPGTQVVGNWTFTMVGVRGTEPVAPPQMVWYTPVVDYCGIAYKGGTMMGSISVEFAFNGVGSYIVGRSFGGAVWEENTLGTRVYWFDGNV